MYWAVSVKGFMFPLAIAAELRIWAKLYEMVFASTFPAGCSSRASCGAVPIHKALQTFLGLRVVKGYLGSPVTNINVVW